MARAIKILQVVVIFRPRVGVPHHEADRCAGGEALVDAGEDLDLVALLPLRGDPALARPSPIEFDLDELGFDRDRGRAAVDHAPDGGPVRFAVGGEFEEGSEFAAGHGESGFLIRREERIGEIDRYGRRRSHVGARPPIIPE